ncbi:MAG: glycosyltransferase family 2 protein [Balneolaceae bacterium]|nr:glycosyltransferase family 2 protein [Balneolaceae bacterium]MCH8549578.1 glycosyltransferase family 2 protein [Balneolaceae bacterium]
MQKKEGLPVKIRDQKWDGNSAPLVSIVCLTYNQEDFIADTIEGFLDQETTFPVEILIHDDASADHTVEIVESYREKFPSTIRTVFQTQNQFSISGDPEVNVMYPIAKGKYIALCEGDDYWIDPKKLEKQVALMEENPQYVLCVGGYTRFNQESCETRVIIEKSKGFEFTLKEMRFKWLTKTLTALFRREVVNEFDFKAYNHRRDIHLFYHIVKNRRAFYMAENMGVYRIHRDGINSMKDPIVNGKASYNSYKELYQVNRDDFTREMYLKSCLSLLNYYIYLGKATFSNFKLYIEALMLVRRVKELKMFVTVFLERDFKARLRELF